MSIITLQRLSENTDSSETRWVQPLVTERLIKRSERNAPFCLPHPAQLRYCVSKLRVVRECI
jgi:hypothetical protein